MGKAKRSTAIDEGVPAPVLSAVLYQRFPSPGEDDFATQVLSAMGYKFAGMSSARRAAEGRAR